MLSGSVLQIGNLIAAAIVAFCLMPFVVTAIIVAATPWHSPNPADARLFQEVIAILGVNAAIGMPVRAYNVDLFTKFRFDIQSWLSGIGNVDRCISYSRCAAALVGLQSQ